MIWLLVGLNIVPTCILTVLIGVKILLSYDDTRAVVLGYTVFVRKIVELPW